MTGDIDGVADEAPAAPTGARIALGSEHFLRICASDGVMIWNGAARFDEGAGAFFALKPEDEARFFKARAALHGGENGAPAPALDWGDDSSDNGFTADDIRAAQLMARDAGLIHGDVVDPAGNGFKSCEVRSTAPGDGDLSGRPPPRPDPLLRPAILVFAFASGAFFGAAAVVAAYVIGFFLGGN